MSTIIHKPWAEVKKQIDDLVAELQDWRDYIEEVGYEPEVVDLFTDAIDKNLALMPAVIPNNF